MPEIRHTIRFQEMERINRSGGSVVAILRQQGMVLMDDGRAVPPSVLSTQDNINGAGTRTFIWRDQEYSLPRGNATINVNNFSGSYLVQMSRGQLTWAAPVQEKPVEIQVQEVSPIRQIRLED